MDNAQKAIMIGVGLFITIIIISVVLLITNLGTGMVEDAGASVGNISSALQTQLKTQYDRKTIKGIDVATLINQHKDEDNFIIVLKDGTDYEFIAKKNDAMTKMNELKSGTDVTGYEVDASGTLSVSYEANLVRSVNSNSSYNTYLLYKGADVVGVVAVAK